MAFNPIGQLSANGQASSQYVWSGQPTTTANFTHDHLNRDAAMAAASGYDANGNLVSDGTRTFTYDPENRLTGVTGGSAAVSLSYDPFGRLYQYTAGGASTYFSYLGSQMRLEATYNGSSYTAVRDYAYDGAQPFLWHEGGSGGGDFRFLQQDRLGSVIATSTMAGTVTPYAYGPYGEPQSWSGSRFRYTGQIALPEAQLYHYNARAYDPMLGRFLQTDPIRYGDGGNIYAYVHGDPVNGTDPSGTDDPTVSEVEVTGNIQDSLQDFIVELPDLQTNFNFDIVRTIADLNGAAYVDPCAGGCVSELVIPGTKPKPPVSQGDPPPEVNPNTIQEISTPQSTQQQACHTVRMMVTSYNDHGAGSDWAYWKNHPEGVGPGTVAVANTVPKPYTYGTIFVVQNPNGTSAYTGTALDSGAGWDANHHNVAPSQWIDIWLPGKQANQWGVQWRDVQICGPSAGGGE